MVRLSLLTIAFCVLVAYSSAFQIYSSRIAVPAIRSDVSMISHGKGFKRLGRPADQRKALLRGLTTEVIRHGRIRTTVVKAKELRKRVDHMVTLAKSGTEHSRRQALGYMYDKDLVAALFEGAQERYGDRQGGYCRVIREDLPRRGDGAEMAIIELV